MKLMQNVGLAAALLGASAGLAHAEADQFPTGPVALIVPFSPGGVVDLGARVLAEELGKLWGEPVVVENKPGGGSIIGTMDVVRAEADGQTLLFTSSSLPVNRAIKPSLPFDPLEDLVPVSLIGRGATIVSVGPRVEATSIEELAAEASERPIFFGTSGHGSSSHLSGEALNLALGTEMEPVHYKSGGEAVLDIVASRADLNVGNLPAVQSFLADGRIRVLAVLGDERLAALPDVPTMAELGYDNAEVYSWTAVFAPAGTQEAVVERINADIGTVLEGEKFQDFMTTSQMFAAPDETADFAAFVAREMDFWATIAREREITE